MPSDRLRPHLRLLRLPLIFTTVADIWAGYFGVRAAGLLDAPASPLELALLHLAAMCFYGAGMTWNDVLDAGRDQALHPDRPIPGGDLTLRAAAIQGTLLLGAGLLLAALAGPQYGWIAVALSVTIMLYNGLLKHWALPGALAMGLVRYLDVQLGAGFAGGADYLPAVILGLYTAALTYISTLEERPQRTGRLKAGMAAIVLVLFLGGLQLPHPLLSVWFFALAAALAVFMGMRAVHLRSRSAVQRLVLALLLGIFIVNAGSLAGLGLWPLGLATAALAGSFFLLRQALAPKRKAPPR